MQEGGAKVYREMDDILQGTMERWNRQNEIGAGRRP